MQITNQQWHESVTITLNTQELLQLREATLNDLCSFTKKKEETLSLFNKGGEEFNLTFIRED